MTGVTSSRDSCAGAAGKINRSRTAALPVIGIEREALMNAKPSKTIVERVVGWVQAVFSSPEKKDQKGSSSQSADSSSDSGGGKQAGGGLNRATDNKDVAGYRDPATTAGRTAPTDPVETDGVRRELPDLDDSEVGEYAGAVTDLDESPEIGNIVEGDAQTLQGGVGDVDDTDQTLAAQDMANEEERERSAGGQDTDVLSADRSDVEEASGDLGFDDHIAAAELADAEDAFNVHNAVGGDDASADLETDGIIDTSRDADFASGQSGKLESDNVPEPEEDISDLSEQDELIAMDGARSDEFAAGGYAPGAIDQEDIEAASEGAPSIQSDEDAPAQVDDQHTLDGTRDANFGSSASTSQVSDEDTPNGISERQEIEASSRHDAGGLRNDEGGAVPGMGDADDFNDASAGTVEASRSATGNEIDDEQDALGTTLTDSEDTASPFDTDEANLSSQEELSVSDENTDRAGTLESGAISQRGLGTIGEAGAGMEDETTDSYADFPDEPPPETADDAGVDDFAGDDYPSDRRIDRLAGDDPFDAQVPDTGQYGSSAGDLEDADSDEELLINRVENTAADTATDAGLDSTIDQDSIGTSDEHVGGEAPAFVENMQDIDVPAVRDADDVPAGAVPGDGTTNTPDGYPIKGNASSMIYHLPEYPSYKSTKPQFCFATEEDAIAAGYRAPGRRNRGQRKKR